MTLRPLEHRLLQMLMLDQMSLAPLSPLEAAARPPKDPDFPPQPDLGERLRSLAERRAVSDALLDARGRA